MTFSLEDYIEDITKVMAEKRHRDTTLAALLGAIFGVFAVIGYAIAGDKD